MWHTISNKQLREITMLAKDSYVKARVNHILKHDVEVILSHLGITMSDAINALFRQIELRNGLPFDMVIPNKITHKTLEDSKKGKGVKRFKSTDDLFKDLDI